MGPSLGATPRADVLVHFVPVLAVELEGFDEAAVLFVSPLTRIEGSVAIGVITFYRPIFNRAILAALLPRIFRIPLVVGLQEALDRRRMRLDNYLWRLGVIARAVVSGEVFIIIMQLVTLHLWSDEILNFSRVFLLLFLDVNLRKHVTEPYYVVALPPLMLHIGNSHWKWITQHLLVALRMILFPKSDYSASLYNFWYWECVSWSPFCHFWKHKENQGYPWHIPGCRNRKFAVAEMPPIQEFGCISLAFYFA